MRLLFELFKDNHYGLWCFGESLILPAFMFLAPLPYGMEPY